MLGECLDRVRKCAPLVHSITNYVTVNDVANVLLACGGSPIMSDEPLDVEEITALCGGLNLNIGTLHEKSIEGMLRAGKKSNELGHPVLLDPVGAGASRFRTETAIRLMREVRLVAVRGNISEVRALAEAWDGVSGGCVSGGENEGDGIAVGTAVENVGAMDAGIVSGGVRGVVVGVTAGIVAENVGVTDTGSVSDGMRGVAVGAAAGTVVEKVGATEAGSVSGGVRGAAVGSAAGIGADKVAVTNAGIVSGGKRGVDVGITPGRTRGVDADLADAVTEENLDGAVSFVREFARRTECVTAVTGAIDLVSDGDRCYVIRNGRPEMGRITGTGCQLSGLMTAFLAANPGQPLEAAAAAVCAMGLAGEIGWSRMQEGDGNATYRNRIIDAVYQMDGAALEKGANYEIR